MNRTDWKGTVLPLARDWVEGLDLPVTLRQVFYHLVATQVIANTVSNYKMLSKVSAEARRDGAFPDLVDKTREIVLPPTWDDPQDALTNLATQYRIDRWSTQDTLLALAVEKRGLFALADVAVGELGFPIVPLGGYGSQTIYDDLADFIAADGRPAHLLYVGDHDPSGHDIQRDLVERVGMFDSVQRVALTPEQVAQFDLPVNPAPDKDARLPAFAAKYGPVQVEVDALPPDQLVAMIRSAVAPFVDLSAFRERLDEEDEGRERLRRLVA